MTEKDLSKKLTSLTKYKNMRLETSYTGHGIPDCLLFHRSRPLFIELKVFRRTVKFRRTQTSFFNKLISYPTIHGIALIGNEDGFILLLPQEIKPEVKVSASNLSPWSELLHALDRL